MKKILRETKKYIKLNGNRNRADQNLWDGVKTCREGNSEHQMLPQK